MTKNIVSNETNQKKKHKDNIYINDNLIGYIMSVWYDIFFFGLCNH